MKEFLSELFKWLKDTLPTALLSFGFGYSKGADGKKEIENELAVTKLELEKKKNAEIIEQINSGLDDRSIVQRAIDKGRSILKPRG